MELKLYDTLSKEKRVFTPLDPNNVRMYVCGPTVYDFAHIGNARPVIVFDVLFRLLRHVYGADHVTYVRNITDVDDKINDRAARDYPGLPLNEAIRKVTERTEKQFHEDVAALGCLPPTIEPRATEHIPEMRAIIETLIANGNAYVGEDHVLFSVASMKEYGRLARRTLDEMLAGARVDIAPYKREAMDFVLWKPSKPGEPAWPSPAGIETPGRPGWHLECSAMSDRWLWTEVEPRLSANGKAHPHQFDIHGGGVDLVFPHHENEIAQSCCAFHTSHMARTWMHNGFLMVEGEKMSKSLGNFITIRELKRCWRGQPWAGSVIRWAMFQTHYRQPIDWTFDGLLSARNELAEWFKSFEVADNESSRAGTTVFDELNNVSPSKEIVSALEDDLNLPAAIAGIRARRSAAYRDRSALLQVLRDLEFLGVVNNKTRYIFGYGVTGQWPHELTREVASATIEYRIARANGDDEYAASVLSKAKESGLQFDVRGPHFIDCSYTGSTAGKDVEDLIAARAAARAAKNWKESDRIRDELAAMGIILKDGKDQDGNPVTTWEVAR